MKSLLVLSMIFMVAGGCASGGKLSGDSMVSVAAGCFDMGDNYGDGDSLSERPVHKVCLDDFRIDKYEVTQAEYKAVVGANPSEQQGCPDCPVEWVTWVEAKQYCEKVGKRLPTEAQWEYAARDGGKKVVYGTGKNEINESDANYGGSSPGPEPVGSYHPNSVGLYDMAGNVSEWVADWYGEGYYGSSPGQNPKGPDNGNERVLRGGSWLDYPYSVRASFRFKGKPDGKFQVSGFRCAQ